MTLSTPLVNTYAQYPFEITSGKGTAVYDSDGKKYLDLYGGHAVCAIGHSHPKLIEAIEAQAKKLFFYSNLTKLSIRTEAAEKLLSFANSHLESVFFCNSGAEANENALRLALQLTGREQLVALKGGFHGRTTVAASVTDNPEWHNRMHGWRGDVLTLEPNKIEDLKQISTQSAAVIVEPIQSIGGVTTLSSEYLKALREQTSSVGALLIFDEIQTGVGRTGVPFVNYHSGVKAEITTTAKSLGGGFPVGAMLMERSIADEVKLGDLGSTFGGTPLGAAAIIATLEVIEEENLVAHAKSFGEYAKDSLTVGPVREVRGSGCLLGLKLNREAKSVVSALRESGILTGTSGVSDVMRLLPSLTTTREELDSLRDVLKTLEDGA